MKIAISRFVLLLLAFVGWNIYRDVLPLDRPALYRDFFLLAILVGEGIVRLSEYIQRASQRRSRVKPAKFTRLLPERDVITEPEPPAAPSRDLP
jgi:hypothetical protein